MQLSTKILLGKRPPGMPKRGQKTKLTAEEEEELIVFLNNMAARGLGLSKRQVQFYCYDVYRQYYKIHSCYK